MTDFTTDGLATFQGLSKAAKSGGVTVELSPSEFVALEHACVDFSGRIRDIRRQIQQAGDASADWGLGEKNPRLTSAQTLVARFVGLATDIEGNSAYAVLDEHYQVVEEIRDMFRAIRESYMRTDEDFAAAILALDPTLTIEG